jgi:ankyrin repeat protein
MAAFNRLDELRRAVGEKPDLVKERLRTPWAHRPEQRSTLLGIALLKRYREMAKFLIEAGAPLDTREYAGLTPLHLAAGGGDPELIRLLVARGLDVNARDEDQTTPLHCILNYAGNPGDPDAFTTLIQAGADVNARTTRGGTPLPRAVDRNRVDIVRILVAAGADPTIAYTHDGQTALDMARRKKSELAKWPANRPLPDYYGDGVMSLDVARKKNAEIVKLLEEAVRAKPSSDGKSTK